MSDRMLMTVLIYLAPGEAGTFAEYERAAMPVMAEHGGRAECMMRPTVTQGELDPPDEVHVLSFETEDGFERYRADPRVVALAPLRERAIARVVFMRGPAVPPYSALPGAGGRERGSGLMDESPHKGVSGVRRVWNALRYSLDGLTIAYRMESAFRQEVWLSAVMIPAALVLDLAPTQKALLIACVLLVLAVELLNSAVEATVDRISLDRHMLAKRAKDTGSAAVFIALVNCAVVWSLVLADVYL